MIKRSIILIAILQIALLSCGQKNVETHIEGIKLFQESLDYPYTAYEERKAVMLDNMNKLEKGMADSQVIELMTYPDEVNLTYNFKKAGSEDNIVGFSLVYILRRNVETGSVAEKDEQLLRIHFDESGKLLWAYSIDIDEFEAIEKE